MREGGGTLEGFEHCARFSHSPVLPTHWYPQLERPEPGCRRVGHLRAVMSMAASSGERHGRPGPEPGSSAEYNNEQSVDWYPRYGLVVPGSMGMQALDTGNRTMTIEYELRRTDGLVDRVLLNCVPMSSAVLHGVPPELPVTRAAETRARSRSRRRDRRAARRR